MGAKAADALLPNLTDDISNDLNSINVPKNIPKEDFENGVEEIPDDDDITNSDILKLISS